MRVKCVKASYTPSDGIVINSDMMNYISIGALFWVYGIRVYQGIVYIAVFVDNRHIAEIPLELFEVIEDKVTQEWRFKVWEDGSITFWPDLFYEANFLENFAEWECEEREKFSLLQKKIEIRCPCKLGTSQSAEGENKESRCAS